MIGKMDEYLVHQTEKPLLQVASEHPEWQDRFYFNIHDRNGEIAMVTGFGAYPNRATAHGYLLGAAGGEHFAYLNVRRLEGDREVMRAGSLSYTVVEPLTAWRLEIGDEANGIRGELEFRGRCPLYAFSPIEWQDGDHLVVRQMHYTQAGVYSGSLTVGDRTFTELIGIRDRSWGVRDMARVPVWIWISAQFPRFCVSAWLWETPAGEVIHQDGALTYESGEVQPITRIEHELQLNPGSRRPKSALFRLGTADGEKHELSASEIGSIYLMPPLTRWSDGDAEAAAKAEAASFGYDQHSRFQLGGENGIGVVEYMLTGGYRRYGIPPVGVPRG